MSVVRAIVVPDAQIPFHCYPSMRAMMGYLRDTKVDWLINIGDWEDNRELSRFVGKKLKTAFAEDNLLASSQLAGDLWAEFVDAANASHRVFLEGNHESRAWHFSETHPGFAELLDPKRRLRLDETNTLYVPADSEGSVFRLEWKDGKIAGRSYAKSERIETLHGFGFIHGWYHNKYHSQQTVARFGHGSIGSGHTHDMQRMQIERFGPDSPEGITFGSLCAYEQPYIKSPTRWQKGFGELLFDPKNPGLYEVNQIRIVDGRFIGPNGKVYDGQWRRKKRSSRSSKTTR